MRQPSNRSEIQAVGLTLATLLCAAALADASAAAVVLQGRRDGSSLGEHRRHLVDRMVQHFQDWQAAPVAMRSVRTLAADAPAAPRLTGPAVEAQRVAPRPRVHVALLNLPPPDAAV